MAHAINLPPYETSQAHKQGWTYQSTHLQRVRPLYTPGHMQVIEIIHRIDRGVKIDNIVIADDNCWLRTAYDADTYTKQFNAIYANLADALNEQNEIHRAVFGMYRPQ